MPVKKRRSKARKDELSAWSDVFDCEFDFWDALPEIGVETDAYGLPDREVAREAWSRLGAAFMDEWRARPRHAEELAPWALTEFGEPKRRAGCR